VAVEMRMVIRDAALLGKEALATTMKRKGDGGKIEN